MKNHIFFLLPGTLIYFCVEEPSSSVQSFGEKGDELSLMTFSQHSAAFIRVCIVLTAMNVMYILYRKEGFSCLVGQNLC